MSKRLQVVLDEEELEEIRRVARRNRMTVSEWVRHALRESRRAEPRVDHQRKLTVVREAAAHAYPSGEIAQMLREVGSGCLGGDG